jgi:hypothetical protein
MNLKKISIELSVDEVTQILKIALDEQPQKALEFIKKNLLNKVYTALQAR